MATKLINLSLKSFGGMQVDLQRVRFNIFLLYF